MNFPKPFFVSLAFLLFTQVVWAQTDSIWNKKPEINFSGFIDVFYAYDLNKPTTTFRQSFFYNHNRHNEFNINLGFIRLAVDHAKYRAKLALHAGTYVNDNHASEPDLLKNIFEANVGLSLNKKNNLWLDLGIFGSHIGFESAISIENWNLTRSILAENSPYYLSGAKLTYNPSSKWELAALVCNGWQHIQRLSGNSLLSMGTQIKFTPNKKTTLNWSTFLGTDDPDSTRRMRYFNNFYGQFQLSKKFGFIAGFDLGIQQKIKNSAQYDAWFSPVIIARYALNKQWTTAIRGEYYQDATGIIIPTNTPNGFKTTGFSINLDHAPTENLLYRLEARWLNSRDQLFQQSSNLLNNNFFMVSSIALRF